MNPEIDDIIRQNEEAEGCSCHKTAMVGTCANCQAPGQLLPHWYPYIGPVCGWCDATLSSR